MWPNKSKLEKGYIFRVSSYRMSKIKCRWIGAETSYFGASHESPLNSLVRSCYMCVVVQQEKIPKVMFGMNISSLEGVLYKGMSYVCIYKMGPITRIYEILSSCFYNKMNQFVK